MKTRFFWIFFLSLSLRPASAQTVSGIINQYAAVTAFECDSSRLVVNSAAGFFSGRKVLIIQMQGATVSTSNDAAFGDITSLGACGNYEINRIQSIAGNKIVLKYKLTRPYDLLGKVQIVQIPEYNNLVASNLSCEPWNGVTGGVLIAEVRNNLILTGDIDVSGRGFRGGTALNTSNASSHETGYFYGVNPAVAAAKGEGCAIIPSSISFGRGKVANGGGGGNAHNGGGGGGGNGGAGGNGGLEYYNTPGSPTLNTNGLGGLALFPQQTPKAIMGGGGGAGHMNDQVGSSGGNGGGIVMLKAKSIIGNQHHIKANGLDAFQSATNRNDGQGGGGAGGSVFLEIADSASQITVEANGGRGADCLFHVVSQIIGPGGGGGGGRVALNQQAATIPASAEGGLNGIANQNLNNGAQPGMSGLFFSPASSWIEENSPSPYFFEKTIHFCEGDTVFLFGIPYIYPGTTSFTFTGPTGCDTTYGFILIRNNQIAQTYDLAICPGESIQLNGAFYTAPDTVSYLVPPSAGTGCDTLVTYRLTLDTNPSNCITCNETFFELFGQAGEMVQGLGIYDAGDGNFYVTGIRQDSAMLMKVQPNGEALWTRTFDVTPGIVDLISEIIVDTDGMIAGCGQSGVSQPISASFVFRYDPINDQMLWMHRNSTESPYVFGILELPVTGNYLVYSNPHLPLNNAKIMEYARADGQAVVGPMSRLLDVGGADNYNSALILNDKFYGVGRFTLGNNFTDMRHVLSKIDLQTGVADFHQIGHLWAGPPARLYGMDLLFNNGVITSVGFGDEAGEDLNNSRIFLYQQDAQFANGPVHRINLLETTSEAADEIVAVPGGYIILAHSLFNSPDDLFLIRISTLGQIIWAKKFNYQTELSLPASIIQSQILVKDNFLYWVGATADPAGGSRMFMLKTSLDGALDGSCPFLTDTPAESELIQMTSGQNVLPTDLPLSELNEFLFQGTHPVNQAAYFECRSTGVDTLVMLSLCPGETLHIDQQTYTAPDTIVVAYLGANGCDSVVTYLLSLLPQPARTEQLSFCDGSSIVINGQTYFEAGIVVDTIVATSGCDTLVTYVLTKLPLSGSEVFLTICPGESVVLQGNTYTETDTVTLVFSGANGCDSIVTVHIERLPQPTRTETLSFCPGESVVINGVSYTAEGIVIDTLPAMVGCDTIVTYVLQWLPQPTRTETLSFCPGESVVINGVSYTAEGIVIDTLPAMIGCDTIVTYLLSFEELIGTSMTIQCPEHISLIASAGMAPIEVLYDLPVADSDCSCPGMDISLIAGLPSGALFPNGTTQVCYQAEDACGQTSSCCFNVQVREVQPCDVKVNGCMRYELLSITADVQQQLSYRIRVVNNCPNPLIYTAIQLPDGTVAVEPPNLSLYAAESGRPYEVRNPNYSPFYSIRFKSTTDSIANGQADVFRFTLPEQSAPQYFNITSRLAPQLFFEAHLNTFYCPVGMSDNRGATTTDGMITLYPNPSTGELYLLPNGLESLSAWQIFNRYGQMVCSSAADNTAPMIQLPGALPNGLYAFKGLNRQGEAFTLKFVLMR